MPKWTLTGKEKIIIDNNAQQKKHSSVCHISNSSLLLSCKRSNSKNSNCGNSEFTGVEGIKRPKKSTTSIPGHQTFLGNACAIAACPMLFPPCLSLLAAVVPVSELDILTAAVSTTLQSGVKLIKKDNIWKAPGAIAIAKYSADLWQFDQL